MSVKRLTADIAKEITNNAISKLIEVFKENPTIYLEEKHLHNEFDRIFRNTVEKNQFHLFMETKDGINFPILMNEYPTFHKYKAVESFQTTHDESDGVKTGSIDYVLLDPDWISKHDYIQCVNKDDDFRGGIRKEIEINKKSPFLISIEFKFLHFGKKYESYDDPNNSEINESTKKSRIDRIKKEIKDDSNKQLNEEVPSPNVVYFNSDLPLPQNEVENLLKELKKELKDEFKEKFSKSNLVLWYSQGGVSYRFKKDADFYHLKF